MRPLALPSEIMRLDNLCGYLKFPGPWPVARIRLPYVKRPKAAESFVPRDDAPLLEGQGAEAVAQETGVDPRNEETDPSDEGGTGAEGASALPLREISGNEASGCEEPQRESHRDRLRNY